MNQQKVTILYERLSRDDELQGASNSILNQRQLLEEYAERNDFVPYVHICDDGWSGTRWDRPGWQELIAKVESGEVGCICVKDGSRMGRDYLRVGLYRELFREKGVRLIAVNDNFDSERGEDDFTPFREIMAEWYARDTSKKIRSVIAAKGKSGKHTTNQALYGFIRDPNDKNHWLIDPEAADVVRRIFQMVIGGMGIHQIAGKLAEEKVERPSYYLGSRGIGRHKNDYNRDQPFAWAAASVANILRKPEYAGHTVNFRTSSQSLKSKKYTRNAPENWLIFPDTHEAIVDQETFDTAQRLRETKRRRDSLGEANPLTGLLFCADCGAKLYNHRKARPQKPNHKVTDIYECSSYKMSKAKFHPQCSAHRVSTEQMREIILSVLRATSGYIRDHEQEFMERVRESSAVQRGDTAKNYERQITKNERRLSEIERIYKSLYEDKALGKIDGDVFDQMTGGYLRECDEIKLKTEAMQAELDRWNSDGLRADQFLETVRRYTSFEVLTPAMLNELVDKVVVHEGEWSERSSGNGKRPLGSRTQSVDVYLKYIGQFDVPDTRTAEEIEAERVAEEKAEARRAKNREYSRKYRAKKPDPAEKPAV